MERQDPTASELLTHQFYEWERRGRGWLPTYEVPVDLEPPFHPFFHHTIKPHRRVDDSRVPTFFSEIVDFFKGRRNPSTDGLYEPATFEIFPCKEVGETIKVFSITLPRGSKVSASDTEQWLVMLSYCRYPLSFEIVAWEKGIRLQIACRESDAYHVRSQLKAYVPKAIVKEQHDLVLDISSNGNYTIISTYGLEQEFTRPLQGLNNYSHDPFMGFFAVVEHLAENEYMVLQILFSGTGNAWGESILRSVIGNEGKGFFVNAPEMVGLAKEKVSSPLFSSVIKILGSAPEKFRTEELTSEAGNAFVRIYSSESNSIVPLSIPDYDFETRLVDIKLRQSHRVGMLLNAKELTSLVHFPSESVTSNKLERDSRKTKLASPNTERNGLVLGINEHEEKVQEVVLATSQRLKHMHIVGATGTGKSTLLVNLISQDIEQGRGLAVLDPHGDLIDTILAGIPKERAQDVLIIDPSDSEFPIGFNFLSAHSEIEKDILSSDLVAVFRRLSASWGDQMNSVFANAILAFVESSQGGTLVDLRKFLVEKSFRETFLKTVTDPNIVYYWQKEYPLLKSSSIGSILIRLDTFLRPKLIRNMVAQKKGLDFGQLMDTNKIILVKLSQGLIGAENSYLLGTVIVSKIQQAAMARQVQVKEERNDFFLYIDEFQNFITPSMASILSGARKYHLGLILAHQDMAQLIKQDAELASSVMSNAGTRICFRVGDTDAKRFADGFSFFEAKDLQNLNTGEAIVRIDRSENDFSLTTQPLEETFQSEELRNEIIASSRERYATPRHIIEELFKQENQNVVITETSTEREIRPKKEDSIKEIREKNERPVVIVNSPTVEKNEAKKEATQHQYLQFLIKRMAESKGYIARIEEPTPDGKGRVDVSLERNKKRIAVEVCVTTESEWEMHNIQKCLDAGYGLVVECSPEKKTIDAIKKKVESMFASDLHSKILILEPNALFEYLDKEVVKDATTETVVKGYRVKVNYDAQTSDGAKQKQESIARIIADSMRKNKKK